MNIQIYVVLDPVPRTFNPALSI